MKENGLLREGAMIQEDDLWENWYFIKERIRDNWGNLSDDELDETKGNISEISNLILKKSGENKLSVIRKLVAIVHPPHEDGDQWL